MFHDKNEKGHEEIERIFRILLPKKGLVAREEQITLCHTMLDSVLENNVSICNAGVGIGKTYAYLTACVVARKYALGLERSIVISTSSVALQKALIEEYLPFLSKILLSNGTIKEPLTACLRKGKERFVCDERFEQRLRIVAGKRKNEEQLAALRSLIQCYDLDAVTGLSDFDRRQVCVPKACPKDCIRKEVCRYHVYRHKAKSGTDTIQICNHNYLLADAEHRQRGLRPLLKEYGILVIDEAHKLAEAACQMYGESLSSQDFEELYTLLEKGRHRQLAEKLWGKGEQLLSAFKKDDTVWGEGQRLPFTLTAVRRGTLRECEDIIQQVRKQLCGKAPRWLLYRLEKMEKVLSLFGEQDSRYILYLNYDRRGNPSLCATSRNIPRRLCYALWERPLPVILTSGTLKAGKSFAPVVKRMGLETVKRVRTFSVPSPFDYERNCLLYFPVECERAPRGSEQDSQQIAEEILRLVKKTYGHTLVLFTSYSLMGTVYNLVKNQMPVPLMEVWRNSQDTIRRFKREQNAVLFAAGSCWEGIDFPGDMVSSLIIPRLPFPVPDPIREAQRSNYMTLREYIKAIIVPEMQVKLRQGFGRAIRTENDTCTVAILDQRAAPGGKYHREVIDALPAVPVTQQIEDVERFIRARKGPNYFL